MGATLGAELGLSCGNKVIPGLPTLIAKAGTGGWLIGFDVGAIVGSWKNCDEADSPNPADEPPGLGTKTPGIFAGLCCWFTGYCAGYGLGSLLVNEDVGRGLLIPFW